MKRSALVVSAALLCIGGVGGTGAGVAQGAPRHGPDGAHRAAATGPMIPNWVKRGLVVHYEEVEDSGYLGVAITTAVSAVNDGAVHATTLTSAVGTDKTYQWTCTAAGYCLGGSAGYQFWVDPGDPIGSVSGQGLSFAYLGTETVQDPDQHRAYTVGVLHYSNGTTIRSTTYFQKTSGLVIWHDEVYYGVDTEVWYAG